MYTMIVQSVHNTNIVVYIVDITVGGDEILIVVYIVDITVRGDEIACVCVCVCT